MLAAIIGISAAILVVTGAAYVVYRKAKDLASERDVAIDGWMNSHQNAQYYKDKLDRIGQMGIRRNDKYYGTIEELLDFHDAAERTVNKPGEWN